MNNLATGGQSATAIQRVDETSEEGWTLGNDELAVLVMPAMTAETTGQTVRLPPSICGFVMPSSSSLPRAAPWPFADARRGHYVLGVEHHANEVFRPIGHSVAFGYARKPLDCSGSPWNMHWEARSGNLSSTTRIGTFPAPEIEASVWKLISYARDEQFEPGMESDFARGLTVLLQISPISVLTNLKGRLAGADEYPEVLAEILRWAGRQDAIELHDLVLPLLVAGLHHRSSIVRDAAAIALVDFDQLAAKAWLMTAIENEMVPELRADLEDLAASI